MSPSSSPRGPAEELQRVLDGVATPEESVRQARLVRTVGLLTDHRAVAPRPAFSAELRARLMDAAETELVPDRTAVVRALRPVVPARRRVGVVAASLMIVGGTAGVAAASGGALPGEPLYPVKRGTEQVVASLQVGDAAEGRAILDQATTRLQEARTLQSQDAEDRLVTGALAAFGDAADDGSQRLFAAYQAEQQTDDVAEVRGFAATSMRDLAGMSENADPVVAASLVEAADQLADLDEQARSLCSDCSAEDDLITPTSVAAGAGKATVDALLTRPVSQASLDREAVTALEIEELRALRLRAEESAGELVRDEELQESVPPVAVDQHGPVASTLTNGSPSRPTLAPEGPVRELLSGVTGTAAGVTGTVRTVVPRTGTPLDDVTDGVTGSLEDTLSGVTGDIAP